MSRQTILRILLVAGFACCLAQVWIPDYYLTGDGPCHLYNAGVLHDMWAGKNTAFYSKFYRIMYDPNPNWLSHILLSLPLYFVSGIVAEKLLLTLYVTLLVSGFYMLIKKVRNEPSFWMLVIFLPVFNHTLAKGFYNFTLATAFFTWLVLSWLWFLEKRSNRNAIIFFCFAGLTFFTQLLPFVFGLITCFGLVWSYAVGNVHTEPARPLSFFLKNCLALGIFTAPFLALMFWFVSKEHGLGLQLHHHFFRFNELVTLKYLVSVSLKEKFFTTMSGVMLVSLFLIAIFRRFMGGFRFNKHDGLLFSLLVVGVVYFFFPENFLSRAILITMRVQLFLFILMALAISAMLPINLKNAGGGVVFICFLCLSFIRLPVMLSASEACTDYNSAINFIKPNSVVLPLDFSPVGLNDKGKPVSNCNYLFPHALHYGGLKKSLIFLDNYEALTGYFPLIWNNDQNPYLHLSRYEGIEAQPPAADIDAYEKATGTAINYVVLWGYDSSFLNKGHYNELHQQIVRNYHSVYTSPTRRTMVYERNVQ